MWNSPPRAEFAYQPPHWIGLTGRVSVFSLSTEMPRLLSLFSGTGAVELPFLEAGWQVQSLDVDGRATINVDILKWDYRDEPPCDVLIAGVPCENYSIANTRGVRNLVLADSLVRKTWEIIQHFAELHPTGSMLWFIENPDSSWLWKRRVSEPFPHRVRLDFCQYSNTPYRKRTKLATNAVDYVPKPLCNPRTCASCVDGKHIKSAQRGPCIRGGVRDPQDTCTLDELHAYPRELCQEIFEHCHQRQWSIV